MRAYLERTSALPMDTAYHDHKRQRAKECLNLRNARGEALLISQVELATREKGLVYVKKREIK